MHARSMEERDMQMNKTKCQEYFVFKLHRYQDDLEDLLEFVKCIVYDVY